MRRARDCTAGVFEILANKSLVAVSAKCCAKREKPRRDWDGRQGSQNRLFLHDAEGHFDKAAEPEFLIRIGAIENRAGLKAHLQAVPGSTIVKAGFDRVLFSRISRG